MRMRIFILFSHFRIMSPANEPVSLDYNTDESIPETDGFTSQSDNIQTDIHTVGIQGQSSNGCIVTSPSDDCGTTKKYRCINTNLRDQNSVTHKHVFIEFNDLREELRIIEESVNIDVPLKRSKRSCKEVKKCNVNRLHHLQSQCKHILNAKGSFEHKNPQVTGVLKEMTDVIFRMNAENSLIFSRDFDGDTKLHLVIIYELEEIALTIIDSVIDYSLLDIQNQLHQSPLHLAVLIDRPSVARRLMSCGVEIDLCDHLGNTPLHIACREGNTKMADLLLTPIKYEEVSKNKSGIQYRKIPQDLNIRNFEGETCLDIAFRNENNELLELLIEKGADVDQRCLKTGRTLLYRACAKGNLYLVKYLIVKNCNVNARAYDGSTPFDIARAGKHWQIAAILAQRGAESDSDDDMK